MGQSLGGSKVTARTAKPNLSIELARSGEWHGLRVVPLKPGTTGEPGRFKQPVRVTLCQGAFLARPGILPLRSESVSSMDCLDVLEYISGDDRAIDELARVLEPGGVLRIRVPATGPLAGFDSYNLMHYLVDTSRRGLRPYEISEVGWRRHYGIRDLEEMLGRDRLTILRARRRGLALAEIANVAAMVLFRWLRPNLDRYQTALRLVRAIERIESGIRTPIGFRLEIEAKRLP